MSGIKRMRKIDLLGLFKSRIGQPRTSEQIFLDVLKGSSTFQYCSNVLLLSELLTVRYLVRTLLWYEHVKILNQMKN